MSNGATKLRHSQRGYRHQHGVMELCKRGKAVVAHQDRSDELVRAMTLLRRQFRGEVAVAQAQWAWHLGAIRPPAPPDLSLKRVRALLHEHAREDAVIASLLGDVSSAVPAAELVAPPSQVREVAMSAVGTLLSTHWRDKAPAAPLAMCWRGDETLRRPLARQLAATYGLPYCHLAIDEQTSAAALSLNRDRPGESRAAMVALAGGVITIAGIGAASSEVRAAVSALLRGEVHLCADPGAEDLLRVHSATVVVFIAGQHEQLPGEYVQVVEVVWQQTAAEVDARWFLGALPLQTQRGVPGSHDPAQDSAAEPDWQVAVSLRQARAAVAWWRSWLKLAEHNAVQPPSLHEMARWVWLAAKLEPDVVRDQMRVCAGHAASQEYLIMLDNLLQQWLVNWQNEVASVGGTKQESGDRILVDGGE